jgi:hypothetical protein
VLSRLPPDQLHLDRREIRGCRQEINAWPDIADRQLANPIRIEQGVIEGLVQPALVDAEGGGGIALRVGIDDEDPVSPIGEECGEIDSGRCLADAALLIRDRYHARISGIRGRIRQGVGNVVQGVVGQS